MGIYINIDIGIDIDKKNSHEKSYGIYFCLSDLFHLACIISLRSTPAVGHTTIPLSVHPSMDT